MLNRSLFLFVSIFAVQVSANATSEQRTPESVSQAEYCSALSGQYRMYAEAYSGGALWKPGTGKPALRSGQFAEGMLDAMLFAAYNSSEKTASDTLRLNRSLIDTSYQLAVNGRSVFFGQAYVFLNCMGLAPATPEAYAHCDNGQDFSEQNLEYYMGCFSNS